MYVISDLPFPLLHRHWRVFLLGRGVCGFVSHPLLEIFCMDCCLLLPERLAFDTVLFPVSCIDAALFSRVGIEPFAKEAPVCFIFFIANTSELTWK